MKQFKYTAETPTAVTVFGNDFVLTPGNVYSLDANAPLVRSLVEQGYLEDMDTVPAEVMQDKPKKAKKSKPAAEAAEATVTAPAETPAETLPEAPAEAE